MRSLIASAVLAASVGLAAAPAPAATPFEVPEGGLVLDGADLERAAAAAPTLLASASGAVAAAEAPAVDEATQASRRPVAFEYSDGYYKRLKIHKYASYAMLPMFIGEYAVGQKLYNDVPTDSLRSWHRGLAGATAVLFAANTVTGVWNMAEARKDPTHRTRKMIHGGLMLLADAGFVATGMLAPDHEEGIVTSDASTHRTVALASMGVATIAYLMMLIH
jgi:hypothetical protein